MLGIATANPKLRAETLWLRYREQSEKTESTGLLDDISKQPNHSGLARPLALSFHEVIDSRLMV